MTFTPMELTEIAQRIFANDRYATQATGIHIDLVESSKAICSLKLSDKHRNAKGSVMGGVFFTLADFAFAVAANASCLSDDDSEPHLQWVSSTSTIHFLATAKGDTLTATATPVRQGRSQAVFQIVVTDSEERNVAIVTTLGTKVNFE